MAESYRDIIAENELQVDMRGALCIFDERDYSLLPGLSLTSESFLMCKFPFMSNESCMACKLKDGNDELIPYIGAELFVEQSHFIWYITYPPLEVSGKEWEFDFSGVTHGHLWGVSEPTTTNYDFSGVKHPDAYHQQVTLEKSVPDAYIEHQLDRGVARLGGVSGNIQLQFAMKHLDPETEEALDRAISDPSFRFDLDENGRPKEFTFRGSIAQYGSSSVTDPVYTGTMKQPFWQRVRLGAIWPGGYFWEDYYDDHKTDAPDWYPCAWYDTYSLTDVFEVYTYTITCWRYMDRHLQTWRYLCIDVDPELSFNSNGFHSNTARLEFNKLQLDSVAPAEDLDLEPLAYLQEE